MVHTMDMAATLLITIVGIWLISRMARRKPPTPKPPSTPDEFDVLIDEYMIYDPDLDGKI